MKTNAQLSSLNNMKLPSGTGNISASDHKSYNADQNDNSYATVIRDTNALQNFTELVSASTPYAVNFVKQGRNIQIYGSFRNNLPVAIPAGYAFYLKTDSPLHQYLEADDTTNPQGGGVQRYFGVARNNLAETITVCFAKTESSWGLLFLSMIPPMAGGNYWHFNFDYPCKN